MPDLVAQGPERDQHWRRSFSDKVVTLGRTGQCEWDCPWDENISRLHAFLEWKDGQLHVRRNPQARNAIFYLGQQVNEFDLKVGEFFVIGRTKFTIEDESAVPGSELPSPVSELSVSIEQLRQVRDPSAADRIDVLTRLPGLIRHTPSDEECERQVCGVLLGGVPRADVAAVVRVNPRDNEGRVQVRAVCGRRGTVPEFRPSRRLVLEALQRRR